MQIEEYDARVRLSNTCSVLLDESKSRLPIIQNFEFIVLFLLVEGKAQQLYVGIVIFDHQDSGC